VPTDRPIDGVDQSDFLLGKQQQSRRESVLLFYGDTLLAVKWRNFKIHLSLRETSRGEVRMPGQQMLTSEVVTPGYPLIFDVSNDPKELWNIAPANTWIGEQGARVLGAYYQSLRKYPNIAPGAADGPG
jgi:arylsulfatase